MKPVKKIDFSTFSSIRVGPVADVIMIDSYDYPAEGYLIGGANNILVGSEHPSLMKLSKVFDTIRTEEGRLVIGAATPGGKIVSFCKKHDIGGFEFISHLPGTLGGMVKMNAGLKAYEIFNSLLCIRTGAGMINKEQIAYGYRSTGINDVVFEATFSISKGFDASKITAFRKMRTNQPHEPSAGSCFKNPKGDYAGRLIEAVGLKGYGIGDMQFSDKHANFLVNRRYGTFDDAINLIRLAQERVYKAHGVWLENEVIVLDRRYMGKDSPLLNPMMRVEKQT